MRPGVGSDDTSDSVGLECEHITSGDITLILPTIFRWKGASEIHGILRLVPVNNP